MYYVRSIFLEYSDINTDKNNMTKIIIVIKLVIILLKKIMMDIFFFSFFSLLKENCLAGSFSRNSVEDGDYKE